MDYKNDKAAQPSLSSCLMLSLLGLYTFTPLQRFAWIAVIFFTMHNFDLEFVLAGNATAVFSRPRWMGPGFGSDTFLWRFLQRHVHVG